MNPTELDNAAKGAVAIVLLLTILSPAITKLGGLEDLQFGHPKIFVAFSEVAALLAFLLSVVHRHTLHLLPDFWLWLVMALVIAAGVFWLAKRRKPEEPSIRIVVVGLLLYAIANGALIFGISQVAADTIIYYRLNGEVTGTDVAGIPVYLHGQTSGERAMSRTDDEGRFRMLLTRDEAERAFEVRAQVDRQNGENWNYVDWTDLSQRDYSVTLELP